jgi:peptidoglycan/LPS O-acetylase OafA/YrhL
VAVSAVVGFHALRLVLAREGGDWGDVSPVWWWAGTGRLAVDAFFVLAGFLVVASWRSCRARAESTPAAVAEYARRRGWRILPPYLVMLAVVAPLASPGWPDLLRLVTLQQYLDPQLPAEVNVPIWSLTTEVHFYLVAPVVAWLLTRVGGWPLVLPATALAVWWAQTDARGELAPSLLPGRLDQFLVGAAAGALILGWESGRPSRLVAALTARGVLGGLLVGLLTVGTYHGATHQSGGAWLLPHLVHPVAGVILAGLLVRLTCGPTPRLCLHPALTWLGGISFSLYLWHYPILDLGLARVGPSQPAGVVVLVALALVGAGIAVAWAAHALVERPSARRARGLAVLEPELRLEDLQEVPPAERDEARRSVGRRADDAVVHP